MPDQESSANLKLHTKPEAKFEGADRGFWERRRREMREPRDDGPPFRLEEKRNAWRNDYCLTVVR